MPRDIETNLSGLLQETFGVEAKLASYEILNQHTDYYALRVSLKHPPLTLAVKLAGADAPYPYPFERTAMFHRPVAAQTSIPMPEVIAVDVSYRKYPWRYLVKTYLPGEEWNTVLPKLGAQERANAHRQIGNAVGELHSIRFESFGEVDAAGSVPHGAVYQDALIARVQTIVKNRQHRDMMLKLVDANAALFEAVRQPRLCHEDLHKHNILFRQEKNGWRLATILDFDKAWAGHHEIDLAKLELWTGMVGDGFWDAYNRLMPGDDGYAQRRPIYQLLWCLEYAANTVQHLADTRRLCEHLNLPVIEQFE
ncbi:MAG: aminoglycoside phosphotransferase family protein [Anaerolineae bacterium]|nr:aminoglycoside phosphotransferase family protein [Anaerolineae bacterium]